MTFIFPIILIVASFPVIINPEKAVRSRNEALIKKGKPALKEEDLVKDIKKTKSLAIMIFVAGIIILLLDIAMYLNK